MEVLSEVYLVLMLPRPGKAYSLNLVIGVEDVAPVARAVHPSANRLASKLAQVFAVCLAEPVLSNTPKLIAVLTYPNVLVAVKTVTLSNGSIRGGLSLVIDMPQEIVVRHVPAVPPGNERQVMIVGNPGYSTSLPFLVDLLVH